MTNEVQIFNGLKIKEENGQVMFDAETAAIGLGISQIAKSGNEVVRWERVNKYLGIPTSGDAIERGDFITEPQFYKLAIKANNETAERFQDWVTTEVLPSIRKTGVYGVPQMSPMERIALLAQGTTELDSRVTQLEGNQPLNSARYEYVGRRVNDKVREYIKLHNLNSKNVVGELRKDLNHQIKVVTGVRIRRDLRDKHFDQVMELIDHWTPSTATVMQLNQTQLEV
ncbi:hypothetical protein HAU43_00790 [Weissella confusa]|uniref:Bro-N domain-containing protein n=1 Tax=Weissella confusa TaxID=1583 RepID=A0AAE2S4V3_WEICO|nr:ORF6C domain-containing protein [Weissella confusa]MBJ7631652.1 hypothetical protein [Weissella confusa]MBJ7644425.1 hypothetical protein [Weissella confusa]TGE53980.1 hypothetical protein C6P22_03700 [Weissella confusa]